MTFTAQRLTETPRCTWWGVITSEPCWPAAQQKSVGGGKREGGKKGKHDSMIDTRENSGLIEMCDGNCKKMAGRSQTSEVGPSCFWYLIFERELQWVPTLCEI